MNKEGKGANIDTAAGTKFTEEKLANKIDYFKTWGETRENDQGVLRHLAFHGVFKGTQVDIIDKNADDLFILDDYHIKTGQIGLKPVIPKGGRGRTGITPASLLSRLINTNQITCSGLACPWNTIDPQDSPDI